MQGCVQEFSNLKYFGPQKLLKICNFERFIYYSKSTEFLSYYPVEGYTVDSEL